MNKIQQMHSHIPAQFDYIHFIDQLPRPPKKENCCIFNQNIDFCQYDFYWNEIRCGYTMLPFSFVFVKNCNDVAFPNDAACFKINVEIDLKFLQK